MSREKNRFAAAAAKSLQSCPTLCNPRDSSPPGSFIPGILQTRTLEWLAISFSNAWKWKVKVKSLSCPTLSDPLDCSLPGSSIHGIFQARVLEWSAIAFSTLNPIVIYFILFFWKHLPIWTTSWKVLLAGTCRNLSGLTFTIFSSPSQPFWYLCNAENTKLREKGYQWHGRDFLDFSGGPVAENPCSQCKGPGFNSWSGN